MCTIKGHTLHVSLAGLSRHSWCLRDHWCPPGGGRTQVYPTYRGHVYILGDALSRYVCWCSILARCHICMQMYGSYDNKAVNLNSVHVSRCVLQTQQSAHILSDSLSSSPRTHIHSCCFDILVLQGSTEKLLKTSGSNVLQVPPVAAADVFTCSPRTGTVIH